MTDLRKRKRLDLLLVEQGLAVSREQARRLIMAGAVVVNDQRIDKPGTLVPAAATVRIKDEARSPYVSHAEGTRLVVEYIEKFWCPSLLSTDLLK